MSDLHPFEPGYIRLIQHSELAQRVRTAYLRLKDCDLCPWKCRVNRGIGKLGICRTGRLARLSSFCPHMGEEKPLSGWRGSGTIFFAGCNMHCQFCQNHEISQTNAGVLVEPADLAAAMLELQAIGCHNINLVSPSHVVPQILAAVLIAAQSGLHLPLVYNTGGYDSIETLKLLDGVIDIYMPDMKYSSHQIGWIYSKAPNYPSVNQAAVLEMHRQVGDLQIDDNGLAVRGLLVRHLVLPNGLAGTEQVVRFLAEEVSSNTYLNLMDQYHPEFMVKKYPNQFGKLSRPIKSSEYQAALQAALASDLRRLYMD